MYRHSIPLGKIIHENFSLVLTHAFSQPALIRLLQNKFMGEWKYLCKACFETSETRANRALIELAILLRILDDEQGLSQYDEAVNSPPIGTLILQNDTTSPMNIRDMTNKIIHSSKLEWNYTDPDNPMLICHCDEPNSKWKRAEFLMTDFAFYCGRLGA